MFVQWCVKGIRGRLPGEPPDVGIDDAEARDIIDAGTGIQCNWLRRVGHVTPAQVRTRLTKANLDLHVNAYNFIAKDTPYISLTAGCVERDAMLRANRVRRARDVALSFATDWGQRHGYLFHCWVVVGLKPAVSVEMLAEEVRELNTYQSYSAYQLEGELTAKIVVPANQIQACERWDPDGRGGAGSAAKWQHLNPTFDPPALVSNIRDRI